MTNFESIINGVNAIKNEMDVLREENRVLQNKIDELEQANNADDIAGYIYIVVHPRYPELVKFGYSKDVRRRMREFNNAGLPDPHHCYAIYGITKDKPLDKKIHKLIDSIDPDIRYYSDKEFYRMDAERAYGILRTIAEVSCTEERLILNPFDDEYFDMEKTDTKAPVVKDTKSDKIRYMTFDSIVFNGKQYNCDKYTDVIRTLARVLYKENPKIIDDIVDVPKQNVRFVTEPIVYRDNTLRTHKFDDNVDIYIYDSFSADEAVKHCYALIKLYGYKDTDLTFINMHPIEEEKQKNTEEQGATCTKHSVYAKTDLPAGYYYNKRRTVRAHLSENREWTLMAGSVVNTKKHESCNVNDIDIMVRDAHVRDGKLVDDVNVGKVSPSTAAARVTLRSTSGWEYWYTVDGVNVNVAYPREKIS